MDDTTLNLTEAARELGITQPRASQLLAEGGLPAVREGREWRVARAEVARLKVLRRVAEVLTAAAQSLRWGITSAELRRHGQRVQKAMQDADVADLLVRYEQIRRPVEGDDA